MKTTSVKVLVGTAASLLSSLAMAGQVTLGTTTHLPILEGGIVTVGIAALVAGIRIIKRNSKR